MTMNMGLGPSVKEHNHYLQQNGTESNDGGEWNVMSCVDPECGYGELVPA